MYYLIIIFLSSFLLFQVQPLLGKFILPWYGGGPAVWTVCLLFFQSLLLAGYLYSYLISKVPLKIQARIHGFLVIISLACLPIIPHSSWQSHPIDDPTFTILLLLLVTVGLPYLLISATSPLIQHWYGLQNQKTSPYRLYALSNVGSLLGLLSYPFVLEPNIGLKTQGILWSVGYTFFVVFSVGCVYHLSKLKFPDKNIYENTENQPPSFQNIILWLMLAANGNLLLLSITNHVTQDIAPIPFLWILILSLYLLSFIISFDKPSLYKRWFWGPFLIVMLILSSKMLINGTFVDILFQIVIFSVMLFVGCMVCHGELYRLKPGKKYLTFFYVIISFGGVLGGGFVSIIAPRIFDNYWEIHLGLILICILFAVCMFLDKNIRRQRYKISVVSLFFIVFTVLLVFFSKHIKLTHKNSIYTSRNFYGALRVIDRDPSSSKWLRTLKHGRLTHGKQLMDKQKQHIPTSYYYRRSGVGLAFAYMHGVEGRDDGLHVGAVGLGIGTIAALVKEKDRLRFYEINPEMVRVSKRYFTYLDNALAQTKIVMGDARIQMEKERQLGKSQQFDILIIDAFNSDAIPMHLMTQEAFALYDYHLKSDGILAVHISAIHLDLGPVVKGLSRTIESKFVRLTKKGNLGEGDSWNDWILVTRNRSFLQSKRIKRSAKKIKGSDIIST